MRPGVEDYRKRSTVAQERIAYEVNAKRPCLSLWTCGTVTWVEQGPWGPLLVRALDSHLRHRETFTSVGRGSAGEAKDGW